MEREEEGWGSQAGDGADEYPARVRRPGLMSKAGLGSANVRPKAAQRQRQPHQRRGKPPQRL
jgi:hypothetical protein